MKPFICVGDSTSGGGSVISGSATNDIDGRSMARVGDKATCPRKGHGGIVTIAASSDPTIIIDGQPAAFHGAPLSCGCSLIAGQFFAFSDPKTSAPEVMALASRSVTAAQDVTADQSTTEQYDEQVHLGAPAIEGLPYLIETFDGRTFSGRVPADGKLPRIDSTNEDQYTVHIGDEALARMEA